MPAGRAAAAAAVARGKLYVVGGRTPTELARTAFVYDLETAGGEVRGGPVPREHLAAASVGGRVYALAGRKAGYDTNFGHSRCTTRRGDAGRASRGSVARGEARPPAVGRRILSVGGRSLGTIATVYAYNVRTRRWSRLPDLPTPSHGLGLVVARGGQYALAGPAPRACS